MAAGAGRRETGGPADGECRQAPRDDLDRARRICDLLATTEAGRRLLERTGPPPSIGFVDAPDPVITGDGAIQLDPCATDAENAARLGHLLQHAVDGALLPRRFDGAATAGPWIDDPIAAEARAIALEIELRVVLGVVNPRRPYPFESEVREAPAGERVRLVRSRLEGMMPSTAGRPPSRTNP